MILIWSGGLCIYRLLLYAASTGEVVCRNSTLPIICKGGRENHILLSVMILTVIVIDLTITLNL